MVRRKNTPSSRSEESSRSARRSTSSTAKVSDARRQKSGAVCLREIKYLQRTTHLLIPRKSFQDAVRQVVLNIAYRHNVTQTIRFSKASMEALQEAAEMYLVNFFEDASLCSMHAKRVTIMVRDFELTRQLRGPSEICNT